MELLKTILNFISNIAYPLVLGLLLILFRKEIRGLLEILRQFFLNVKDRFERGDIDRLKLGGFEMLVAKKIITQEPDSAGKIIQDLLSPAAPLALGYFDNFLKGLVVQRDGGFKFLHDEQLSGRQIKKAFTIYIPLELPRDWDSFPSLVNAAYAKEQIENISIESQYGRPFTAFAILRGTTLYPVDVPKTLTSIQRVFEYRAKQLLDAKVDAAQIKELEVKNLNTFADIIQDRTRDIQQSGCIRVVREPSKLFSDSASESIRRDDVG